MRSSDLQIGDWVVLEVGELSSVLKIDRIDEHRKKYWFHDGSYLPIVDDDYFRLWTIEDAKDGDVLVGNSNYIGNSDYLFIYTGKSTIHTVNAYCGFDAHNNFIAHRYWEYKNDNIKPATKEQRDILFQKMKEAGYEWDKDTKVLNKVTIYE